MWKWSKKRNENILEKRDNVLKSNIHWNEINLNHEPRKQILPRLTQMPNEPEMSEFESAFLCGILEKFHPRKIVEVGIAGGGHNRHYFTMYGKYETVF